MTSSTLKQSLRLLMAEHGMETVHQTLQEILREDYEYLQRLFGNVPLPPPTGLPVEPETVLPDASVVAPTPPLTESSVKKMRVRVTKAKAEEAPASAPALPSVVVAEPVAVEPVLNVLLPTGPSLPSSTVSSPRSQPAQRSAQDIKKFQKLAEETKRRELKEKGVTVDQVLTRENLQKWIVEEKHTFAWVAREKAGCPETQVSSVAKSMGIQSPISIRRGMMVGKKA